MDPRIKQARALIEQSYGSPLPLNQIAQRLHLSASRFEHLFKQAMQQTYKSYLRQFRLRKAKRILGDRTLNISKVAYRVGYSSPSSFTRDFRKAFTMTSSVYRRQALGDGPDDSEFDTKIADLARI